MKKNKEVAVWGFIIGILVCVGVIYYIIPKFSSKVITDADVAGELIEDYREVEAVCGEDNVYEICIDYTSGCGYEPDGFTCKNWERAAHPGHYDEDGYWIED